jgi:hypothetical protein
MRQLNLQVPCTLNVVRQCDGGGGVRLTWHTTLAEAARRFMALDALSRADAWISVKGGPQFNADEVATLVRSERLAERDVV